MTEVQMIRDLQEQVKNLTVSRESSKRALDHYLKTNMECERLRRQLAQVMKDQAAAAQEHAKAMGILTTLNKDLAARAAAWEAKAHGVIVDHDGVVPRELKEGEMLAEGLLPVGSKAVAGKRVELPREDDSGV